MTTPKNHHFVPQMLLRQWARTDDKLLCWRWRSDRVECFTPTTKSIMAEMRLYEAEHIGRPELYEAAFSQIEADAAPILKKFIHEKPQQLSGDEFHAWSLFILAQRARTPEKVKWAKQHTRKGFLNIFEQYDPEFDKLNTDKRFSTPADFIVEYAPNVLANFHLHTTMQIIFDQKNVDRLCRMKWFVRKDYRKPIILSDDPVIIAGGLHEPKCIVALPISPSHVFFAVSDQRLKDQIVSEDSKSAAVRINNDQALQAQRFVIGDVEPRFLENRMRRAPQPFNPANLPSQTRNPGVDTA